MTTQLETLTNGLIERSMNWQGHSMAYAAWEIGRNINRMVNDGRTPSEIAAWIGAQDGSFVSQEFARLEDKTRAMLQPLTLSDVDNEMARIAAYPGVKFVRDTIADTLPRAEPRVTD